jgi:hypothetical protein
VTDKFGRLITVDKASGAVLSRVDAGDISIILPNYQTDRLYIGSQKGMIQCLREVASKIPYFHADEVEVMTQPAAADLDPEKPMIAEEDDPFRTPGQQPGTPDRKPTAADDPFAIEGGAGAGNAGGQDAGAGNSGVEDDPFK